MENPSIKTFLLAPTFLLLEAALKKLWGVLGPSGMGTIKPENQGGLVPSGTTADLSTKLGWGQQQADLSFLEPQHVVSQHRGWKWGEGICSFQDCPCPPPPHSQIGTDSHQSNHVTLDLRAFWIQGIHSQPEPREKLSAEQSC